VEIIGLKILLGATVLAALVGGPMKVPHVRVNPQTNRSPVYSTSSASVIYTVLPGTFQQGICSYRIPTFLNCWFEQCLQSVAKVTAILFQPGLKRLA
jgi:hypothetical protein